MVKKNSAKIIMENFQQFLGFEPSIIKMKFFYSGTVENETFINDKVFEVYITLKIYAKNDGKKSKFIKQAK